MLIRKLKNDALLEIQYLNTEKKTLLKMALALALYINVRTLTSFD